jgi:hypothetical protein
MIPIPAQPLTLQPCLQNPAHVFFSLLGVMTAISRADEVLNSKLSALLLPAGGLGNSAIGSISSKTLLVKGDAARHFEIGMIISGRGVLPNTKIVTLGNFKDNVSCCTVSISQKVAETTIFGSWRFTRSLYIVILQTFVLWWYWKDIMAVSETLLVLLNVNYEFVVGLRPLVIFVAVLLFDANFVFSKGLRYIIILFSKASRVHEKFFQSGDQQQSLIKFYS